MPSLFSSSREVISGHIGQLCSSVTRSSRLSALLTVTCLILVFSTVNVPQARAQAVYGLLEGKIVIDEGVFRPDVLPKIFPSHDLLGVLQQDPQDFERLTSDFLAESGLADLTGLEVNLEDSELQFTRRARWLHEVRSTKS